MQHNTTRVSVLTPIYNTNPVYLREMIESILTQTFADFEFLILNDSPDNTEIENIVLEYAAKDPRIQYFKNDKNIGITPSRNKLLKMARGEYVAIFDHDDISMPDRLARQVEYLDANPNIGVVSAQVQYFGMCDDLSIAPEFDADIRVILCYKCCVAHTAAMVRKSVLIDNKIWYEELYSPAEDYRLWARLMDVTQFYNIQEVLVKYRWMGDNTSKIHFDRIQRASQHIINQICDRHPKLYEDFKKVYPGTRFRLRLFGKIPLLKIKQNKVYLFEFIPIFTIRWC